MPLLFSYGSLQREDVQRSIFGRLLAGRQDELAGFDRSLSPINDAKIVATTGQTHYANVLFNGVDSSRVSGMALEVTDAELELADRYEEIAEYKRFAVPLASGKWAWVYVDAHSVTATMATVSRKRGCLLGLACGDALGTTVEFSPRGSFTPVTDMVGGGPFRLPAGAWTDDTSMALCLASSLAELGSFDPTDQMRRYCQWFKTGYLSSTGHCFDIGNTVRESLERFQKTGNPVSGSTEPRSAGNGCIMRLAPVPIFYHPDCATAIRQSAESSRTTHGAAECIEACQLLAAMICAALSGRDKDEVLFGHAGSGFHCSKVRAIAAGDYRSKDSEAISGSGYVIDCLEAAAWCFWRSVSFREAVLMAVNLGEDADTTGAVCGQLAGAFFGEAAIPSAWLSRLFMVDEIRSLTDQLSLPKPANQGIVTDIGEPGDRGQ